MVLAVDVAANGDRPVDRLNVALLEHQLLDILTQFLQVILGQVLDPLDLLDPPVEVHQHGHCTDGAWRVICTPGTTAGAILGYS